MVDNNQLPRKPILPFKDMLAKDRTDLAKKRNRLAKENTKLAIERTRLANERNMLAKERTLLANERTLLAYIRTSLTVFAGAVTLIQFFESEVFVKIGWSFVPISLMILIVGVYRHFVSRRLIDSLYESKKDSPDLQEATLELKNN